MAKCISRLVFVVVLIALANCSGRELKCDPTTGKIRVLYLGDALAMRGPFPYFRMEPSFAATPVQACTFQSTIDFIRKQIRYYMPRSPGRLRDGYDVVILSDANRDVFRPVELSWLSEAVTEEGLGIIMIGGAESYEGRGTVQPTWSTTTVADVLPVQMLDYQYCEQAMRMIISDPEAELAKSLPWQTLGTKGVFSEGHKVVPKQTSHLIAVAETLSYGRLPHLVWWDVGNGRGFSMTTDWTPAGGAIFMTWEYYPDFCINVVMFTAGRRLPDDVDLVYILRRRLRQYDDMRKTLSAMIEIVDSFGGNLASAERAARECDRRRAEADGLYFSGEYSDALGAYDEAIAMVDKTIDDARILAKKALLNIYIIEWAAVTGTFLLAGVAVYTLMIRRRLYEEVRMTRLKRAEQ